MDMIRIDCYLDDLNIQFFAGLADYALGDPHLSVSFPVFGGENQMVTQQ
ncbi:MAG: hypothetical protein O8C66_03390 [Candidatus Methanoperedens sp.]|nr:hypothetical protein [Candidatus Methanoperedens sp.]MCZ7369531.1 hypothetical protein [Candidatus Methanoperedens sp.]